MAWQEYYREHLDEQRDAHGDIVPPWVKYPDYERYTIGWRMGAGESWLCFFRVFLETLPEDEASRLAYLRRHPPAPISWADTVAAVLNHPEETLTELKSRGLIKSDVAFANWCLREDKNVCPSFFGEAPVKAARYRTREFGFWSRANLNRAAIPQNLTEDWAPCENALRGAPFDFDLAQGLLTLAQFLCAGKVRTPWDLHLSPSDSSENFEMDMNYVDAFSLYVMSVFDDNEHLERELEVSKAPSSWGSYIETQLML